MEEMEKEVLSSSLWDPGTGLAGMASGEAQTGYQEAFLNQEGGKILERLLGEGTLYNALNSTL